MNGNWLRLVLVTDVRFWHRQTGAQRRIDSLVSYLQQQRVDVTVFFAGTLAAAESGILLPQERTLIDQQQLKVQSLLDDWRPQGWFAGGIWEIQCVANWLKQQSQRWLGLRHGVEGTSHPNTEPMERGPCLADFDSPVLYRRFHDMLKGVHPQAVIVEYVTLGYLVPQARCDQQPHYLLDTHDLLSERNRQFQQFGFRHWLDISPHEEAAMLSRFDTVIAIQQDEQRQFQEMLPANPNVIVAGHPADTDQPISIEETLRAEFTLGYFGSQNPSNVQALQWFFGEVWPQLRQARPTTQLLLAGSICQAFRGHSIPGVQQQLQVDDLRQLYRSFQIAINPVQFGTGLKIKNQEALAFGKPLVVTRQGMAGMIPASGDSPLHVVADASSMVQTLMRLASDAEAIARSAQAAADYSRAFLTPDHIYAALMACLRQIQPAAE